MDEWLIFKDIVVIVGLIITVTTPLLKLNTSITELKTLLESVVEKVETIDSNNTNSHRRLWEHNTEQDQVLQNHERRLHDLDGK